jgi:hypothetical protein
LTEFDFHHSRPASGRVAAKRLAQNPSPLCAIEQIPEALSVTIPAQSGVRRSPRLGSPYTASSPESRTMKTMRTVALIGILTAMGAMPVIGQVHKFFSPGTVWTITMIKMAPGMDQSYLEYLDGRFKKTEDAQIKAGFEKSYKILRTMDDGGAWNLLILREYTSLASLESNVEKADALSQETDGNDQAQMQGYQERSKYREVVGTKYARELALK